MAIKNAYDQEIPRNNDGLKGSELDATLDITYYFLERFRVGVLLYQTYSFS